MSWPGGQYTGNAQPDPNALYQQFQLQPGPRPPATGVTVPPAPFSTSGLFTTATQHQAPAQPSAAPAAMDNAMQMLLARAMSIPLATVLFQSLMGTQQPQPAAPPVFQSAPMMQPPSQSQAQSPMIQMMQQAFQAAAASSAATAQPHITVPPPSAAQHLPTPASSPSTSSAIQLPQMEPTVAKEMLVQLVQQLQQAGQLPYDDTIQRLIQPNANATRVQVKKEDAEEQPGQNPMCVISKTETCDEKPQPEVYMDVAEDAHSVSTESTQNDGGQDMESDGGDDDEGSVREMIDRSRHSPRITKKPTKSRTQTQTRQQNIPQTQQNVPQTEQNVSEKQKSSSHTTRSSAAVEMDAKLQKKCIVKLPKVQVVHQPPPQQSRIDRLKNMKKYCFSTDVLQNHSSSESKPSTAAAAAAAPACSKQPIDHKSAAQEKIQMPVHQQPAGPSARVGPKNIFSIFAQHVVGRGVHQDEPAPEVRPSDPLPPSAGVLLQRSINAAQNDSLSLRSMYLGYASHNMEWLSLVSGLFGANRKTFCQCTFCPSLGEFPRDVAVHISRDHQDLLFALNKLKPVVGPLMYIKCRHCNFVTVESTVAWIHFDIHHGISDILDCSDRAVDMDMSGPDMPAKFIDIDDVMGSVTAYVCYDCSAVNADVDLQASSMLMARHVVRHHPNSINCNGNFVKLQMLTRTAGDPDSIKGSPTYRQAICDSQHARGRREVYICMFCRYSAYSPYLALSHSISAHQRKQMLYICNSGDCDYQVLAEVDMAQHMKVEHSAAHGATLPLVCSATLVEKKSSGDGFVECPVLVKRTGNLELLSSSYMKSKSKANSGASTASRAKTSRRRVSSSSDDDDEDDDEEDDDDDDDDNDDDDSDADESPHRLRNHGRNAKSAKRLKMQKEVPARQTRNSSKEKTTTTTTTTVRSDEDAESEEEVQNMTVTSSNDHTTTTTAVATVTADQVAGSNEETGELDKVAETTNQVAADERETGKTADELTPETSPAAVADDSVCNNTRLQSVDQVSETTALDHDHDQLAEANKSVAADETETEETATTADDDAGVGDDAAASLLTQEYSASD